MDKESYFWKVYNGELPPPPSAKTLGLEVISVDAEVGAIEVRFQGSEALLNPAGFVQGGFLAAMLDDATGLALASTLGAGELTPTASMTVQYYRPVLPGAIKGVGRLVKRGREVSHLEGQLFQDDQLMASASVVAVVRKLL